MIFIFLVSYREGVKVIVLIASWISQRDKDNANIFEINYIHFI